MKQRKHILRYLLLHCKGRAFERLVKYVKYHSLADLLIEFMQLNVVFQPPAGLSSEPPVVSLSDLRRESDYDTSPSDASQGRADHLMTEDQHEMKRVLDASKLHVVRELIKQLECRNNADLEAPLNASAVLSELVETEKTFEIFMQNDAQLVGRIMESALDPTNTENQKYLLNLLSVICKQLKPQPQGNGLFKEAEDDGRAGNQDGLGTSFDPESPQCRNIAKFLRLARERDLVYNLLILLNGADLEPSTYQNQQGLEVRRFGLSRLRALELLHNMLSLLHPTLGPLARVQLTLMNDDSYLLTQEVHPEIRLSTYLSDIQRKQLLKTMLVLIREYKHCSISNQMCIMILDSVKSMFDVSDIVTMQKFVLYDFRARHRHLQQLAQLYQENGLNQVVKKY